MNSMSSFEKILIDTNKNFIEKELRPFLKIPSNTLNKKGIKLLPNGSNISNTHRK